MAILQNMYKSDLAIIVINFGNTLHAYLLMVPHIAARCLGIYIFYGQAGREADSSACVLLDSVTCTGFNYDI